MTRKTILLVEDNPDDVELAMRAFERGKADPKVVVARDGAEALDWLHGADPRAPREGAGADLVLLDLKLPKVDGLEVLRRIRQRSETHLLPVVVLTTSRERRDLQQAYELGANSYIVKPVDFGEFIDAVRQLERYWLSLNEPAGAAGDRLPRLD